MLNLKFKLVAALCFLLIATVCHAQQGAVTINQDQNISTLLALKKELNKSEATPNRYKIQIYNGTRAAAQLAKKNFNTNYTEWPSKIIFDTPDFKIWVGNFRTRLEADRALRKIKTNFPNAFIFKPKK